MSTGTGICGFCSTHPSKYICPQCRTPYCSLGCYQSPTHESCSESFYKASVHQELIGTRVSDEERKRMSLLLDKFERDSLLVGGATDHGGLRMDLGDEEEEEDEMEQKRDLIERLGGLDLRIDTASAPDILSKLLPHEIAAFETQIADSQGMAGLVPIWTPWWTMALETDALPRLTLPPSPSPSQSTLLLTPRLLYNLIEILFSYASLTRSFNGDVTENVGESWRVVKDHSRVLSRTEAFAFESLGGVMGGVLERCFSLGKEYSHTLGSLGSLFIDVSLLLATPRVTVHALNELNKTVLIPASQLPTTTGLTKEDKSRAFKGCKKVEFYVFAVTQSALSQGDAWHAWVDKTVALLSQKGRDWVREDEEIKQITITGKVGNQKRRLVEEIP